MTGVLLWSAVLVPLVAAGLVRALPDRVAAVATLTGAVAASVPAVVLLVAAADGRRATSTLRWLNASGGLDAGLRLDGLGAVMAVTVAVIGLVVLVHATGYFADDPQGRSALAGLLAFLAAMQGLVLADGYLTLLIFWELVGVASARLIAHHRSDPAAAAASVRAFLTTRTADVGLYLAVLALVAASGSLAFGQDRPPGALGAAIGLGLVVAAMGKSAQVPLSTWLSGAMAGPTPVSALLHSATMVAAGVYLLARSAQLLAGWPLQVAGWVGALTAVAGALIALGQDDLKRVLAGSTASQLGLMFVGVAAGGPAVGVFHLVAHAAGKAGMFLCAGVFQRDRSSTALADLRGAGRDARGAMTAFAVCGASIAAVPPLAVFWSKDHIAAASESHTAWFVLVLLAAAGGAAYVLRPALVLWDRAGAGHPVRREGRPAMLAACGALAGASILLGVLGGPLRTVLHAPALPTSTPSLVLSIAALGVGAGGVLLAVRVPQALRSAAAHQLHLELLLRVVVQRPTLALARALDAAERRVVDRVVDAGARATVRAAHAADRVELHGIDAAVDGLAHAVGHGGARTQRLQSGRLYEYLRDAVLGVAAIAILLAITALT